MLMCGSRGPDMIIVVFPASAVGQVATHPMQECNRELEGQDGPDAAICLRPES